MASLPVTTNGMTENHPSRTNRRIVSIVSVGLAVFGCSLLISNIGGKVPTAIAVVKQNDNLQSISEPIRNLGEKHNALDQETRMLKGDKPSKSPSSGLHKPTWKPTKHTYKPSEKKHEHHNKHDKRALKDSETKAEKKAAKKAEKAEKSDETADAVLELSDAQLKKHKASTEPQDVELPDGVEAPAKGYML